MHHTALAATAPSRPWARPQCPFLEHNRACTGSSLRGDSARSSRTWSFAPGARQRHLCRLGTKLRRMATHRGIWRASTWSEVQWGRLVLEMAHSRQSGAVFALDPGGFWRGWEPTFVRTTIAASIRLVRGVKRALPAFANGSRANTADGSAFCAPLEA